MISNGIKMAVANAATVYESEAGALMLQVDYEISQGDERGQHLLGYHTLQQKDGTVSEKTIGKLKECFGWPTWDPLWFTKTDLRHKPVQLTVELEEYQGKLRPKVQWVDPVGSAGGMKSCIDPATLEAKYGAKLRAFASGVPSPTQRPRANPPAPPAPAAPKATPPPPAPAAAPASMEEAWQALCNAPEHAGRPSRELESAWFAALQAVFGHQDSTRLNAADWGRLKARIEDNLPL